MRGEGPLLLMMPGGSADAGIYDRMAAQLADRWTVAAFDPRGYSRSVLDRETGDRRSPRPGRATHRAPGIGGPPHPAQRTVRRQGRGQPFTPIIETLRGLLMGTEIGNSGNIALAWCVGMSLVGHLWARSVFNRDVTHQVTLPRRRPDGRRSCQPSYRTARYEG